MSAGRIAHWSISAITAGNGRSKAALNCVFPSRPLMGPGGSGQPAGSGTWRIWLWAAAFCNRAAFGAPAAAEQAAVKLLTKG
jgi:hypothetical protein